MKKYILHITAHLGGGVGKAIIGMASFKSEYFETKVITLEVPEKTHIIDKAKEEGIPVYICPEEKMYLQLIEEADIIIINWWNHPLMSRCLYEFPRIECRLVAWLHVNGCTYPYIPFDFINQFDYIFFTSRYSYENNLWNKGQLKQIESKSKVVLGNGNFQPEKMPTKQSYEKKESFKLGYVGTLNYSKINRDYVKYCEEAIKICNNLRVILVGDIGKDLKNDIEKSIYKSNFEIMGYKEKVEDIYLSFDVLGYLLNDENYGTTENVILEAMAYGIPVVANDTGVERSIIDNQKNGYLVHDKEEFAQRIKILYEDVELQREMGNAARDKVCNVFSSKKNFQNFSQYCLKICCIGKKIHRFNDIFGDNPMEWFLYFTGKDREIFENYVKQPSEKTRAKLVNCRNIYKGERKSSLKHFLNYFPTEIGIKRMVNEIEEERGNDSEVSI